MKICSLLSYHTLSAFVKLLKNNCMCNGDNARDVAACPDEYNTDRSAPTNQAKIKIKL